MVWDTVQNLVVVATGTAGAGLVVRYGLEQFSEVVERGIDQFFDDEVARQEAELENERVVFSRLHQERATIVVELYERFVQFERDARAARTGPSDGSPSEELLQTAVASGNDFARYYTEHKIYFPPETCDVVERLQAELNDALAHARTGRSRDSRREPPGDVHVGVANWSDGTGDEIPDLSEALENHFRELLGVDLAGGELADAGG